MLATVQSSSLPTSKNKEIDSAKNEINAFKSQQVQFQKSQKLLHFQRTDFGHFNSYSFNSIAGSVNLCEPLTYYWIRMNSYWNVRSLCGGKGAFSVILEKDLLWFEGIQQFQFLCFLTWVMRRTVANINPKIIHFDAVDFSGHHS